MLKEKLKSLSRKLVNMLEKAIFKTPNTYTHINTENCLGGQHFMLTEVCHFIFIGFNLYY